MTDVASADFDWAPLGEQKARELGALVGASEMHLKFAIARHRGATMKAAALAAGYSPNPETIRQTASRLAQTKAVRSLLALLSGEAAKDETRSTDRHLVDSLEARRILSDLARNADPSIRVRAVEGLSKLDDRKAELGRSPDNDVMSSWRMVRSFLQHPNGAAAITLLLHGSGQPLANFELLHDVHRQIYREGYGDLWERLRDGHSQSTQSWLARHLRDPQWQLEARRKIWAEVGVDIDERDTAYNLDRAQVSNGNGAVRSSTNRLPAHGTT